MWETVFDILLDAAKDTLLILPFLLAIHVLIEVFEANASAKLKINKALSSVHAPLFASSLGLVPQCGFSIVATKLYSKRSIKVGTLLAVFIATSDEAIPIILATPSSAIKAVPLLILKFVFALAVGFSVNFALRKKEGQSTQEENRDTLSVEETTHECEHEEHEHHFGCHGHRLCACNINSEQKKESGFDSERFILHPIIHTFTVLLFIFIVNIIMGSILTAVGEERLYSSLDSIVYLQPLLSALVGLIPNCAGSVVIAQMYANGSLTLGAAFAGLSVNAGIAFAVLFKENRPFKTNLYIVSFLFLISVIIGMLITTITSFLPF